MQVLLEVIPESARHLKEDYEAFTIRSITEAHDVFEAEFRKLSRPEDVEKLSAFLNGPLVWKDIRSATTRDISFRVRDVFIPCGNNGFTYRISPYIAGKHSR